MTAEQIFRGIRLAAPISCALALALAALAWQREQWWLVAGNAFLAGALTDASLNAWFIVRTIFRARPVVKVSGVNSTVWVEPPHGDDKLAHAIRRDTCPDCGIVGLVHGPCGGMSMNVFCCKCGAKFNAHGGNWLNKRDVGNTFMVDRL